MFRMRTHGEVEEDEGGEAVRVQVTIGACGHACGEIIIDTVMPNIHCAWRRRLNFVYGSISLCIAVIIVEFINIYFVGLPTIGFTLLPRPLTFPRPHRPRSAS